MREVPQKQIDVFAAYAAQALVTEKSDFLVSDPADPTRMPIMGAGSIPRLLHACLGLSSELSELDLAERQGAPSNIIEELGDLAWYTAIIFDLYGAEVGAFTHDPLQAIGVLSNHLKRTLCYRVPLTDRDNSALVSCMIAVITDRAERFGASFETVLRANLRKLQARYPDRQFDLTACLNRDLDAEQAALGNETE